MHVGEKKRPEYVESGRLRYVWKRCLMCASVMAGSVWVDVGLGLGCGEGGVYARWLRGSAEEGMR